MFENITDKLAEYIDLNPIECLVIGVSGGIDSALCAALADAATQKAMKKIPIIGRSITIESNKADEIIRAQKVGAVFCDDFKELDLSDSYYNLRTGGFDEQFERLENTGSLDYKIAMGNIKARIRMIQLYHLAGVNKGMVLSTDNYTELLLGFWTLHGDVGDYGMVQNLWKTEVYGLAQWLVNKLKDNGSPEHAEALQFCFDATPTDGLGISDSDLDQLGADTYDEVDEILIDYLNNGQHCEASWEHPVIKRFERTHFKRDNPYNIPRKEIVP
jgi:NAD+ synthetase